jgi:hypothetical protein
MDKRCEHDAANDEPAEEAFVAGGEAGSWAAVQNDYAN